MLSLKVLAGVSSRALSDGICGWLLGVGPLEEEAGGAGLAVSSDSMSKLSISTANTSDRSMWLPNR